MTRIVLSLLAVAAWAALAQLYWEPEHAPAPAPLCNTDERFHPDDQKAWDFWMGPYQYAPCKWLPLETDT